MREVEDSSTGAGAAGSHINKSPNILNGSIIQNNQTIKEQEQEQ